MRIAQKSPTPIPEGQRQIFASYHFTCTTPDAQTGIFHNGFGNYVGQFNTEVYEGNLGKFIQDLEKSITMALEDQLKMKIQLKILYFR